MQEGKEQSPPLTAQPEPTAALEPVQVALLASRDAAVRKWASRWLGLEGFEVAIANDAAEALELFEQRNPGIVLVDMSLRQRQGEDLFSALRRLSNSHRPPILALCGSDKEAVTALEQGCTDVARKPPNWPVVSRRADYLARMYRATQELESTRHQLEKARAFTDSESRRLERIASLDELTGLPNGSAFERTVQSALGSGVPSAALLILNLDRFKLISKTVGQQWGDEVLKQVAQRLVSCLSRPEIRAIHGDGLAMSCVARMGEDEFGVLLTNIGGSEDVAAVVHNLMGSLKERFSLPEQDLFVSTSVGVALYPQDGDCAEELLHCAALAMCEAKRRGGGILHFFDSSMARLTEDSVELARYLYGALSRDEFRLHYQPLVDLARQRVVGAEALLRWQHPAMGTVPPGRFVPLAEETGLMVPIGTWVLRSACQQLRSWTEQGMPAVRMAVNVSLCQLVRDDLAVIVRQVLQETNIEPRQLELELSERGGLRRDPDILRQLRELKDLGVRLAVDDFGTGASGIAYLRQLPLDTLKIDRSYVSGVVVNENDAVISAATIAMAHRLHLEVVAEGVEDQHQLEFLRKCGCDEYQGFLFSPPVPAEEFRQILSETSERSTARSRSNDKN
jgi:diguanylate cyclase (GGDEF)-like protein